MRRAPQPARRLEIPEGFVLTNDEICSVLATLNARVAEGDVDVAAELLPGEPRWYEFRMPTTAALERDDAIAVLGLANRAVEARDADLLVTVSGGQIVKRWLTLKSLGPDTGPDLPQLGGVRIREF